MPGKPEHSQGPEGYRLVVGGGGTGGHLFPGIAVAQAFKARGPRNQVLFVNAGRPLEVDVLSRLGWPQQSIAIEGIKGRGRWQQFKAACKIPGAIWRAGRILRRFQTDLVMGVGGYSAGPVVTAAGLLGIPSVLHEQNRLPGLTNRILGRLVDRIYLTFDESRQYFNPDKVRVSGNPVRRDSGPVVGTRGAGGKAGRPGFYRFGGGRQPGRPGHQSGRGGRAAVFEGCSGCALRAPDR